MSERLDMQRLKKENVARRAKLVVPGESFVIFALPRFGNRTNYTKGRVRCVQINVG